MRKKSLDPEIARLLGDDVEPPAAGTITSDRLADLLGVTAARVSQLAVEGVIPRIGRNRFDERAAVRAYCADLRQRAAGRGTTDKAYRDEKTRLAKEQADKLAAANAVATGDLVRAADVAAAWRDILADVRAAMLAVSSRLPDLDRRATEKVDREIRSALEAIADAG